MVFRVSHREKSNLVAFLRVSHAERITLERLQESKLMKAGFWIDALNSRGWRGIKNR